MRVDLQGFHEFEKALAEELPKATARNALTRAGVESMEPVRLRMAQLAPYDPQDRDGDGNHLNETIRTQPAKAAMARQLGVDRRAGVVILTGPAPVGKLARANASWQEDGTVKMPANPYARPAADAELPHAASLLGEKLGAQIEKAKARIARKAARG